MSELTLRGEAAFAAALAHLRTCENLANFKPDHLAVLEPGRAVLLQVTSSKYWAFGYTTEDMGDGENSYQCDRDDGRWFPTCYGWACRDETVSVRTLTDHERAQVAAVLAAVLAA